MRVAVMVPSNDRYLFTNPAALQNGINGWIKQNEKNIKILDVKYQTPTVNGMVYYTAMITYTGK